jgi:hypothetical protein
MVDIMKSENKTKNTGLSLKEQSFLNEATLFIGSNLLEIKKIVESKSLFPVISFAFRNFGFFWKNRKNLMNLDSSVVGLVLDDSSTREKVIDNLLGEDGNKLTVISDILPKVNKFLKSWFLPKSLSKAVPDEYKKLIKNHDFLNVVESIKPNLIKNILSTMEESQKSGKRIKKFARMLKSDEMKLFFDHTFLTSKDPRDAATRNAIIGALVNYSQEANPMFQA